MLDQVRRTIKVHSLLRPGQAVLVGVSGGPDSLCLLHCLRRLQGELGLALHVAHLHHGLRGAEADADADFVQALAADWGLPCTVGRADVPALAQEQGLAFEEAARQARYAFLGRVAASSGAPSIAVGHNADDQAETILMHIVRGSGLAGLRGMLPKTALTDYRLLEPNSPDTGRPIPVSQSPLIANQAPPATLQLIRPLLEVTRAEIEAYCDRHDLVPRFDLSNLDTTYYRNWLRQEVLPLLSQHNPNVRGVLRRSAQVIADDYALLQSLLAEIWPQVVVEEALASPGAEGGEEAHIDFDLAAWRALPVALQRSTLREAIHRLRRSLRNVNFVHVEHAVQVVRDGTTGDQATLPQGLMLTVGYDRFTIAGTEFEEPAPDWPLLSADSREIPVMVPGDTPLPDTEWVLKAVAVDWAKLPVGWNENEDPWTAYLDAKSAGGGLVLRRRRPGDRFRPQGMGGHRVKLADFYTNQKVARAARDRLPLLVAGASEPAAARILWACGLRVDEQARVVETTERVLVVRFVRI